jgi:ABC-type spermidine/putrescine transport system permease subunit II
MTVPANRPPASYGRLVLFAWLGLVFVFLFLPIFTIVVYSFNGGRNLYVWTEWSAHWYVEAVNNPRAIGALSVSLQTAVFNAAIAVFLGVFAGIALARRKGTWTAPYLALIFVILCIPELVSAIGQMIWFDRIGLFSGLARLAVGHSLFNVAVVALIVKARSEGVGEVLEQAAADLGARPWRAFLDVTLPLMFPAVLAGLLLSFTFSFDDVIISLFVQRPGTSTFPIYILSSMKAGLKGDVAALAVMTLVVSFIGLGVAAVLLARGGKGKTLGGLIG